MEASTGTLTFAGAIAPFLFSVVWRLLRRNS
jgi:hypothetical protein